MKTLNGKVAIITGASSGIGAATAEYFAKCGAYLSLGGRNIANLEKTTQKCIAAGLETDKIRPVPGDLTEAGYLQRLVTDTINHFGRIDILVNNAGIFEGGLTCHTPIESYDRVMDVNARCVIQLSQLCSPHLIESKGCIINVSSVAGFCAFPASTFYCMSKAVLDQFTKCLALELASHGVRVNAVNPAAIITELSARSGKTELEIQEFNERCKKSHPIGRRGNASEVAKSIAFLASSESSFTTGHLMILDGGYSASTLR